MPNVFGEGCPSKKRVFVSKRGAQKQAKEMNKRKNYHLKPYKCTKCSDWHLTSQVIQRVKIRCRDDICFSTKGMAENYCKGNTSKRIRCSYYRCAQCDSYHIKVEKKAAWWGDLTANRYLRAARRHSWDGWSQQVDKLKTAPESRKMSTLLNLAEEDFLSAIMLAADLGMEKEMICIVLLTEEEADLP